MQKINTRSKKYDGALRDRSDAYLVAETAEAYTILTLPQAKFWLPKQQAWLAAPDGMLQIFSKHHYYNVWHICENQTYGNLMYINVAIPPTLQNGRFEWIDLDLDYRVYLDHSWEQIDQADFDTNKITMSYPADLIIKVNQACIEIEQGLTGRNHPFDHLEQVKQYQRLKRQLAV